MKNRLSYSNSWEADEYSIGNKRIADIKSVYIDEKVYTVKSSTLSIPYKDMGHQYYGVSKHYFVEEKVFGLKMVFDLNTIVPKKKVIALEFTLLD